MQVSLGVQEATVKGHDELKQGNLRGASIFFEAALKRASEEKDAEVIRACHFNVGACHVAGGRAQKGLESFQQALMLDCEEESVSNKADLYYNIGLASFSLGHYQHGIDAYEVATSCYSETANVEMQAETHSKLGACYKMLGKMLLAVDHFTSAADLWDSAGNHSSSAVTLNSLAKVFADTNQLELCGVTLKRLLDTCNRLQDYTLLGQIFNDIGLIYSNEDELSSARDCFYEALRSVKQVQKGTSHTKELQAAILQNLGATFNRSGQFEKAIAHHEMAIEAYKSVNDNRAQSIASSNAAYAYFKLGDNQKAIMHFQNARMFSAESNNQEGQLLALQGLSSIHVEMGDFNSAINNYKEILALLAKHPQLGDAHETDDVVTKLTEVTYMKVEHDLATKSLDQEYQKPNKEREMMPRVKFQSNYRQSLIAKGLSCPPDQRQAGASHQNKSSLTAPDDSNVLNSTAASNASERYEEPIDEVQHTNGNKHIAFRNHDRLNTEQPQSSKICVIQ